MGAGEDIRAELASIRSETDAAIAVILDEVEGLIAGEACSPQAQERLNIILEACAFHDLTGQRLQRVEGLLDGMAADPSGLLNGPQHAGEGLDQAAADLLFANDSGDTAAGPDQARWPAR